MESVSQKYPEKNPELQKIKQEFREQWRSSFRHLGSTQNGHFTREWTLRDFRDDIELLRNPNTDLFPFLRMILKDSAVRDQISKLFNRNPEEFWKNHNEIFIKEQCAYEEYMEQHYYKNLALDLEDNEEKFSINRFSDQELLNFLKIYNREIQIVKDVAEKRVALLRENFIPNLEKLSKLYSIELNRADIEFRFSDIEYNFFDEYNNKSFLSGETKDGDYCDNTHTVRVQLNYNNKFHASTLQHEHLHAVSGQENTVSLMNYSPKKYIFTHTTQRLGAKIERKNRKSNNFSWLNEAITEQLNIEIETNFPPDELDFPSSAYPKERELFNLILQGGEIPINPKYFYQAYFESDTENPEDAVHRKTLFEEIKKAYGSPIFLVRLDDIIGEFGIIKGLEMFKESGKEGIEKFWRESFVKEEVLLQE